MNRKELAEKLSKKAIISFKDAENLVIAFESTIVDALAKGDRVVYSNFGSFYTVHYPSKVIYHPKLGAAKKMVMLPTNAVKWMPSGNVKDAVQKGKAPENAAMHGSVKKKLEKNSSIEEKIKDFTFDHNDDSDDKNPDEEVAIPINIKSKKVSAGMMPTENNDFLAPEKPGIFVEKLSDGGKEEATFDGAIRLHEKKSFFGKIFGKNEEPSVSARPSLDGNAKVQSASWRTKASDTDTTENKPRVSLVDSGIFDKHANITSHPAVKPADQSQENKAITEEPSDDEETPIAIKVNKTKPDLAEDVKKESDDDDFEFHNKYQDGSDQDKEKKESDIASFNSVNKEIAFIDLSQKAVDKKLLQKIPERVARKYKLAPVEETDDEFVIAMVDPEDIEAKDMIHKYVRKRVVAKLATEEDINRVLDQYNGFESELKEAIDAGNDEFAEKGDDKHALIESASDSAPASRIVSSILRRAIREKASDIHIEPSEDEVEVRYRIDGILIKKVVLPKKLQSGAISRIKILSDMKIDEQRLPQDGRFSITVDDRKVDFRVSTMPVAYGEKVVMRILDKATGILTIEQLGIRGNALKCLQENLKKSHGMMLVTGPTGSGKTTTLYALIADLFNEGVNIVTLEDPIEYEMPGINQSQVNSEIDYTFASGLRSIVRQDPDIIMIGEIRDGETADMAIHAALTGHIVLSTLHTNNSAGAAPRLADMNIEPFLLNSSLNMVIGQRLTRKLCDNCKKEIKLPEGELKEILQEIDRMPEEVKSKIDKNKLHFYAPGGCEKCAKTGYKSRIGLYEVLDMTEEIKSLILRKESSANIEAQAVKEGMVTMLQDGILKAIDGITTIEEVWRVTRE